MQGVGAPPNISEGPVCETQPARNHIGDVFGPIKTHAFMSLRHEIINPLGRIFSKMCCRPAKNHSS